MFLIFNVKILIFWELKFNNGETFLKEDVKEFRFLLEKA